MSNRQNQNAVVKEIIIELYEEQVKVRKIISKINTLCGNFYEPCTHLDNIVIELMNAIGDMRKIGGK